LSWLWGALLVYFLTFMTNFLVFCWFLTDVYYFFEV
jgi:hypothetical protein